MTTISFLHQPLILYTGLKAADYFNDSNLVSFLLRSFQSLNLIAMAFNIVESVRDLFQGELLTKASKFLGESEANTRKAWWGIVPAVMSALVNRVNSPGGPQDIYSLAAKHNQAENSKSDRFLTADLLDKEKDTIQGMFGPQLDKLSSIISQFASVKTSSVYTMTSIATSASLGLMGEHASTNKLNPEQLGTYLNSQKSAIMNAVPGDLDLRPVFGEVVVERQTPIDHGRGTKATPTHDHTHRNIPVMKTRHWLTPILLLSAVSIFVLYQCSNIYQESATEPTAADTLLRETRNEGYNTQNEMTGTQPSRTTGGSMDSSGNFVYNTGAVTTLTLPGATAPIQAGSGSTEAKLVTFLNTPSAQIDTVKGNWFEFTGVTFQKGSSQLTPTSDAQLQNFVAIAKAYPNAKFKIGGYTDNTGDSSVNKKISDQRAKAVANRLAQLGIPSGQIVGAEGYGPAHPIADNNTPEGKAMNRRVAVNVKQK
jgi:OmpA-OmpF porin, OOP family